MGQGGGGWLGKTRSDEPGGHQSISAMAATDAAYNKGGHYTSWVSNQAPWVPGMWGWMT